MSTPRPTRLHIKIVGTNKIKTALDATLARASHDIIAISAVSDTSHKRAERMLPGIPILAPDKIITAADLMLLTIPNNALRPLIAGLTDTNAWHKKQLVTHTSGTQNIKMLNPTTTHKMLPLTLHPMMTFAGRPENVDHLDGAT